MDSQRTISILVADELTLVREGLVRLIESVSPFRVAAQCGDGEEALEFMRMHQPDIALLDLNLPRMYTFEAIRQAREAKVPTRAVVMSVRTDRKTVLEALRCGASGYVLKSGPASHLRDAFEQVMDGSIYLSPLLEPGKIFVSHAQNSRRDPIESLSAREYQVFSLLVQGLRAKEVAARLEISPKTVDTYRASLMKKLDIFDVAGLVKFALQNNLTSP